jgi:excisionase family DNA binding protein
MQAPVTNPLQLITLAQAAVLVGLSPRTLRRAIHAGTLHAHRLGRSVRINVEEMRRWVAADGCAPPAAGSGR